MRYIKGVLTLTVAFIRGLGPKNAPMYVYIVHTPDNATLNILNRLETYS